MSDIKPGYTRVSDFCKRYEDFSAVDPEYLKLRAKVGTGVHQAIDSTVNFVPFKLEAAEVGYYESWFKWYEKTQCKVLHGESRMYCDKFMMTGAIDGIIQFPGSDEMSIVDWKTSSYHDNDVWSLKGTFYHYLVKESKLCEISDKVLYVQLDRNGGMPTIHEYEVTKQLKSLMIATIMCYRFEEKVKTSKRRKSEEYKA
jgi:hypothetical protein